MPPTPSTGSSPATSRDASVVTAGLDAAARDRVDGRPARRSRAATPSGVPYELGSASLAPGEVPRMIGGGLGPYAPGEWSDDTQMAVVIAAGGGGPRPASTTPHSTRSSRAGSTGSRGGASDVGSQTRSGARRRSRAKGTHPASAGRAVLASYAAAPPQPGRTCRQRVTDAHRAGRLGAPGRLGGAGAERGRAEGQRSHALRPAGPGRRPASCGASLSGTPCSTVRTRHPRGTGGGAPVRRVWREFWRERDRRGGGTGCRRAATNRTGMPSRRSRLLGPRSLRRRFRRTGLPERAPR